MKPVTLRRWEILVAFAVLTFAFVFAALILTRSVHENHRTAHEADALSRRTARLVDELIRDKASIQALESTDCRVRAFLLSTVSVRQRLAQNDTTAARRRADLKAAKTSRDLARSFANQRCPE